MFGFLSKGKMELTLEKTNYSPGGTIKGRVSFKLKKPLMINELRVTFYGQKKEYRRRYDYKTKRHVNETYYTTIYEFKKTLLGEGVTLSGEHDFEILIPNELLSGEGQIGGIAGGIMKGVQMLSGAKDVISWYVKATIDMKGLDLNKSVQVSLTQGNQGIIH